MADCSITNPLGCASDAVGAIVGGAIEDMANAVLEFVGKAVASMGTFWVGIGTPNLTGEGGGSTAIAAGEHAADAGGLTAVLGYVTWVALAVAVLSLIALGALIATRLRSGEGVMAVGRVGLVLVSVVLISGAGALVSALMPSRPYDAGGAVLFVQSALWWYMGAAAVLSVVLGAARMAWEQRAEPGRDLVKSLLTLVVVAGAGVTVVGLATTAMDSFSVWLINGALSCDVRNDQACFGTNVMALLGLATEQGATTNSMLTVSTLGALLVIILGLVAGLASLIQIALMVARSGMLVILAGILPLSASFTSTPMGKAWFSKCLAWIAAFILYKPAAAVVYATAFQLAGTDVFGDDGSGLMTVVTGLMLMILALFAMPALMRFVTPAVGALASGAGGGMAAAAAVTALPSGAAAVGRLASGGGSATTGSASAPAVVGPSGSDGTGGGTGPSGGTGPRGGRGATGVSPSGSSTSAPATPSGGGSTAGAAARASGAGAAAGAAGAGSAAAAGSAGGPVGAAAGAAVDAAAAAGRAAAQTARTVTQAATEGGEPNGSR